LIVRQIREEEGAERTAEKVWSRRWALESKMQGPGRAGAGGPGASSSSASGAARPAADAAALAPHRMQAPIFGLAPGGPANAMISLDDIFDDFLFTGGGGGGRGGGGGGGGGGDGDGDLGDSDGDDFSGDEEDDGLDGGGDRRRRKRVRGAHRNMSEDQKVERR